MLVISFSILFPQHRVGERDELSIRPQSTRWSDSSRAQVTPQALASLLRINWKLLQLLLSLPARSFLSKSQFPCSSSLYGFDTTIASSCAWVRHLVSSWAGWEDMQPSTVRAGSLAGHRSQRLVAYETRASTPSQPKEKTSYTL